MTRGDWRRDERKGGKVEGDEVGEKDERKESKGKKSKKRRGEAEEVVRGGEKERAEGEREGEYGRGG